MPNAKPCPARLDTEAPPTLVAYLEAFGLRGRVVIERADGAPLNAEDLARVPVIVGAFGGEADAGRSDDELAGIAWRDLHPGEAAPAARKTG